MRYLKGRERQCWLRGLLRIWTRHVRHGAAAVQAHGAMLDRIVRGEAQVVSWWRRMELGAMLWGLRAWGDARGVAKMEREVLKRKESGALLMGRHVTRGRLLRMATGARAWLGYVTFTRHWRRLCYQGICAVEGLLQRHAEGSVMRAWKQWQLLCRASALQHAHDEIAQSKARGSTMPNPNSSPRR